MDWLEISINSAFTLLSTFGSAFGGGYALVWYQEKAIRSKRKLLKRYVDKVLPVIVLDKERQHIANMGDLNRAVNDEFTLSEYGVISVPSSKMHNAEYFHPLNGKIKEECLKPLKNDINKGYFDMYLNWTKEHYDNINAQNRVFNNFTQQPPLESKNGK